jgi:adenine-specific DNA-methyltransferase
VPAVPIHVHEKIHPQALVEDVKRRAVSPTRQRGEHQLDLFADFNGLDDFVSAGHADFNGQPDNGQ